jgi:hypothetical protein
MPPGAASLRIGNPSNQITGSDEFMPFRAFDASTAKLLERVHDSLLRDVHALYPRLSPKEWAATRTCVIEKLINAGEQGQRDAEHIKQDILNHVRHEVDRNKALGSPSRHRH